MQSLRKLRTIFRYVIMTIMDAETAKRQFLEYIEIERGRAVKTIENYDRYLTRFFTHAKIQKVGSITEESVREFRLWLNRQEGVSGSMKRRTQNYYMIALRAFLKFLRKRDIECISPERIELAKLPDRELDLISPAELDRLMKAADGGDEKSLRDRAILELFFSTGLRVSELCSLDSDIDLSRDSLSVRGKGDKVRVVFISPTAKSAVMVYLKARKDMEEALFVNVARGPKKGARLSPRSRPASRKKSLHMYFATHLRPTFSATVPISAVFNNFLVTLPSTRRRFIRTSLTRIFGKCIKSSIPEGVPDFVIVLLCVSSRGM